MSKDNRDFFVQKKIWSVVKDELLRCYLVPYFNKIFFTRKPILYVDCFAGKGKFDDGNDGSPLVALKCLDTSYQQSREAKMGVLMPQVMVKLIELNHAEALKKNIPVEHKHRTEVIGDAFEKVIINELNRALRAYGDLNVFLYVDPYGIKALNMNLFQQLPYVFSSAELLINLNSFGFIREALRVRKVALRENEDELLADLDEYEPSLLQSVADLDRIAGGRYWADIIDRYSDGQIDIDEAEKLFAEQYKQTLRKHYRYVLDMPIRLRPEHKPKYRMVHATNHPDGCILMADNIFKRTDYLFVDVQRQGQLSLFEMTPENDIVNENDLDDKMISLIEREGREKSLPLNELQAKFFDEYGVICSTKHLSSGREGSSLKRLESARRIEVLRTPPTRNGKPTRFWTEGRGQKIEIKRK